MGKINIGFDEETGREFTPIEQEEIGKPPDDSEGKPKVDNRDRTVYLSEKRIARLKEEMSTVVVHEFGDEYHLNEEERKKANEFYETFKKFRTYKRTYRRIYEYVEVVREALKCLDAVAENNGVYDPEKFKQLWLQGKIKITGLKLPKYKGRDKKNLDWGYVTEFILGNDDPKELIRDKNDEDELITDEDFEMAKERLFEKGALDDIGEETIPEDVDFKIRRFFDVEEETPEIDDPFAIETDRKESKMIAGVTKELRYVIKEIQRKTRNERQLERFAFDLLEDDMEAIELQNRKYGMKEASDEMPEFKGNVQNSNDYHKYMMALKEYERTHIKENYGGDLKTQEQIDNLTIKQILESDGWNIRNMYDNRAREKRFERLKKADKKREKLLKKKLIAIKDRKKARLRRMGEDFDTEKKKRKKKGKKIKDRKKKAVDEFVLRCNDSTARDIDELADEVLDFRMGI